MTNKKDPNEKKQDDNSSKKENNKKRKANSPLEIELTENEKKDDDSSKNKSNKKSKVNSCIQIELTTAVKNNDLLSFEKLLDSYIEDNLRAYNHHLPSQVLGICQRKGKGKSRNDPWSVETNSSLYCCVQEEKWEFIHLLVKN